VDGRQEPVNSQPPTPNSQVEFFRSIWAKVVSLRLARANFTQIVRNDSVWELGVGDWKFDYLYFPIPKFVTKTSELWLVRMP
jgi:hypothetical protein